MFRHWEQCARTCNNLSFRKKLGFPLSDITEAFFPVPLGYIGFNGKGGADPRHVILNNREQMDHQWVFKGSQDFLAFSTQPDR